MNYINPPEIKKVGRFIIQTNRSLGKGAFGTVYAGYIEDDPSVKVAAKTISKSSFNNLPDKDKFIELVRREIQVLQSIVNPNIVRLFDALETGNNIYLFFEFCKDGDLGGYRTSKGGQLAYLTENEAVTFFGHICNGFKCLSDLKIVHRDIKPPNILLHNGHAKIADFGFARFTENFDEKEFMTEGIGTPLYMAPEVFEKNKYSSKCDIWSLGILIYELLYGKTPWMGKSSYDLFENNVKKRPLYFPDFPKRSEKVKSLLRRMLIVDQEKRIDWETVFSETTALNSIINPKEIERNPTLNPALKQSMMKNAQHLNNNLVQGKLANIDHNNSNKKEKIPEKTSEEAKNKIKMEIQKLSDKRQSLLDNGDEKQRGFEIEEAKIHQMLNKATNVLFYERNIAFFIKMTCHLIVSNYTNQTINLDENFLYQVIFILQKYQMVIMKYVLFLAFGRLKHMDIDEKIYYISDYKTIAKDLKNEYDECNKVFLQVYELLLERKKIWEKEHFYPDFIPILNLEVNCDMNFCKIYRELVVSFFKIISVQFSSIIQIDNFEVLNMDYLKMIRFMEICGKVENIYNYFKKTKEDSSQIFYQFYENINNTDKKSFVEEIRKNWINE